MRKAVKSIPWLFIPAMFLIISCMNPVLSVVGVGGNSFDNDDIPMLLNVGNIKNLSVVISPQNATNKGLTWTSQVSETAAIENKGMVTGKKAGYTAIIDKSDNDGFEAEYGITVCTYPIREISLNVNNLSLTTGELYQLVATI